ncbi:MAG: hypothetical protein QF464_21190, partial [Myxococcota bacterium]|nr:hypothetical protein [Myxococcota bacterium]
MSLKNTDAWAFSGLRDRFRGPTLLWHEAEGKRFVTLGVAELGPDLHGPGAQAGRAWCSRIREQVVSTSS